MRLGNVRQVVAYKGIRLLFFHCGKIGHRKEFCSKFHGYRQPLPTPATTLGKISGKGTPGHPSGMVRREENFTHPTFSSSMARKFELG